MDDLNLSQYRKILTLVVTAAVVFALNRYGLNPTDLPGMGFHLTGIAEPVADFLITIGIPAVFTLAQPNEEGESLLSYWRWIAVGLLALGAIILLVVFIGPLVS
jgi:hypothetical protein